jgi:hypothetical protein
MSLPQEELAYSPETKEEWVTPQVAREYLAKAPPEGDRPFRRSVAQGYARDMAHGTWRRNGQGISFRPTGERNNGLHRLSAVLIAGEVTDPDTGQVINPGFEGVWMSVTNNADPRGVDIGTVRTIGDRLRLESGVRTHNDKSTGALARWAIAWHRGERVGSLKIRPTDEEIITFINDSVEILDSAARGDYYARHAPYRIAPAVMAMGHYLLTMKYTYNVAEDYLTAVTSIGKAPEQSPQEQFIMLMIRAADARSSARRIDLNSQEKLGYFLMAWHAYRKGKAMKKLQAPKGGFTRETYPNP